MFTRNRRQGMTVNGAVNLLVVNTLFNSTGSGGVGTSPMEGVDVEPSFREQVRNVVFRDCRAVGNTGAGFAVYLAEYNVSHGPVTLTFENCSVVGTGSARPEAGRGGSTDDQAGFSFGAFYPGMQGLVQVKGGSVMRTRLPAIVVSDKAMGSIPIQIKGLAIDDVGYAPTLCDGSTGCAKKGGYPLNAVIAPITLLWRPDVSTAAPTSRSCKTERSILVLQVCHWV